MADVQIDVLAAAREGAQQLGTQVADLTIELAAQRAVGKAQQQRIVELDKQASEGSELRQQLAEMNRQGTALKRLLAEKDAEIAKLRGDDGSAPALVPA